MALHRFLRSSIAGTLLTLVVSTGFGTSPSPTPGTNDPKPPELVLRDFYKWYVAAVVANKNPFEMERATLRRYVTARLIGEIDGMRKGPDGLDGDYFLDAQDFDAEWGKNIMMGKPAIKRGQAIVDVELRGTEMGSKKLHITLRGENGWWKVDKVEGER